MLPGPIKDCYPDKSDINKMNGEGNMTYAEVIQTYGHFCCKNAFSACGEADSSLLPPVAVPSSVPSLMLDNSLLCEDPFLYMGNATTPFTGCASGLDLCTSEDEWRCDGLMIQLYGMLPGTIKDCHPDISDINKMNGEGNMTYAEVIQTLGHFCCKNAFSACGEADSSLLPPESPSANADKFQNKEAAKYMCDQRKALLYFGQRATLIFSPICLYTLVVETIPFL